MSIVLRYLPRYLADHLLTRGAAMLILGIVLSLPVLLGAGGPRTDPEALRRLLVQVLGNITVFLTLVATAGVVGTDLRQGYYRFIFSRPLSPVTYYGMAFGATLMSFLTVLLALTGIFAVVRGPMWPGLRPFAGWSITFVSLGSLVFVFSRFSRLDWLFAIFAFILGDLARSRWPASESMPGAVLNVLLPPGGHASFFADGGAPLWGHVAWALGYAAVMLALGLLAVRHLPPGEHA
jgi:hypothetical protein